MGWKRAFAVTAVFLATALPALANDAYIGLDLGMTPGQPRFSQSSDPGLQAAFELAPEDWRFSFAQATFDSSDTPTTHIQSQVFGAEKLFIHKFDNRFSMNGAIGIGLFQATLTGAQTGSGSAFGLMATAGGRYQINNQLFTELQFQYRNAAIAINSHEEVDAGWTGFGVNLGFIF
jgi:hypothetical protein